MAAAPGKLTIILTCRAAKDSRALFRIHRLASRKAQAVGKKMLTGNQ